MKTNITNHNYLMTSGYGLIIVIALFFSIQVSAQQRFTILLNNGLSQQLFVDGLKLTFDNNGLFSCWQNGLKQDINFALVGKIYFTNFAVPTNVNEKTFSSEEIKIYPNPTSGIVILEFNRNLGKKIEVSVSNLVDEEVFREKFVNADNYQIDLSNQVSGIYLLKITIDNQQYINKVIIQK